MEKNKRLIAYIWIGLYFVFGLYLIFISASTIKYDSKVEAYQVETNQKRDDDDTIYNSKYYYIVNEKEYECSSGNVRYIRPKSDEKTVYYDSKNPEKCKTEYNVSANKKSGLMFLGVGFIFLIWFIIKLSTGNKKTQS